MPVAIEFSGFFLVVGPIGPEKLVKGENAFLRLYQHGVCYSISAVTICQGVNSMALEDILTRWYIPGMSVGKKIAQLREESGISQRELARKLKVHFQSIGRWERDDTMPDAMDIKKLAEFFKVSMDFFFFDNVPRDGKVDINDLELLNLFEEASRLDEKKREMVKSFLKAFVLREKITEVSSALK